MKTALVQEILRKKKLDAALLYNTTIKDPNFLYVTGSEIEYSFLLVPAKGTPTLLTAQLELARIKHETGFKQARMYTKSPLEEVLGICKGKKVKKLAINASIVSLDYHKRMKKLAPGVKLYDINTDIAEKRIIKSTDELKKLTKACKITNDIMKRCIKNFKTFKTEADAKAFLITETIKAGTVVSFEPIVASAANGSNPHYLEASDKIRKGFCVIDFGVKYQNYCADMTRTIYVGTPSKKEKEDYEAVLEAQEAALKVMKEGCKTADADKVARESLGKRNKWFIHSLGHGVGVEIHELPRVSHKSTDVLKAGMVVTDEPGVYYPKKYGIRIEDTLIITKSKPKVLTPYTKKLITIT